MLEKLCEPHYLVIVVLVIAIIALGVGKGLGNILGPLFKKVLGKEGVNINIGGGEMGKNEGTKAPSCSFVDPNKCPDHKAEHERSMRNEDGIRELVSDLKATRIQLFGKLDGIEGVLTDIKVALATLVVKSEYQPGGRGGKP
jgi:hypothetical protein